MFEAYRKKFTLDESLVQYEGQVGIKQYMSNKPGGEGPLLRSLADSECKFLLCLALFVGQKNGQDTSVKAQAMELFNQVVKEGNKIYADNFYAKEALIKNLDEKKILFTMTLAKNIFKHEEDPEGKEIKKEGMKRSYTVLPSSMSKRRIKVCEWRAKPDKIVRVIYNDGTSEIGQYSTKNNDHLERPRVITEYNKYYKTIDQFDQQLYYIRWEFRNPKWTVTMFVFLIQTCIYQTWVVWNM